MTLAGTPTLTLRSNPTSNHNTSHFQPVTMILTIMLTVYTLQEINLQIIHIRQGVYHPIDIERQHLPIMLRVSLKSVHSKKSSLSIENQWQLNIPNLRIMYVLFGLVN